jgi:hypothetical protein
VTSGADSVEEDDMLIEEGFAVASLTAWLLGVGEKTPSLVFAGVGSSTCISSWSS